MGVPKESLPLSIRKVYDEQYPKGTPILKPPKREKKKPKPMRKTSAKRQKEAPLMRAWHDEVFERDGGKCVRCKIEAVAAHHIKNRQYTKLLYDVKNGLSMCDPCHSMFHHFPEFARQWLEKHRPVQYEHVYAVRPPVSSVTILLDLPDSKLSPNYSPHSRGGAIGLDKIEKDAKKLAYFETIAVLGGEKPQWEKATTQATFYFATNRTRDIRNFDAMLKPYEDGIVAAGLILDDNHEVLTPLPTKMLIDKEYPRVEITITRGELK